MLWLDIETNPSSGCSWDGHSFESNCQYMEDLVNAIKSHGKKAGIYASHYMWTQILGSATACPNFTDVPLWYAHYDNKKTFSDYDALSFGGWKTPSIK